MLSPLVQLAVCVAASLLSPILSVTGSDPSQGLGAGGINEDLLSEYDSVTNTPWRSNDVLYLHGIIQFPNNPGNYPASGTVNNLVGADAIYPSQAYETAITEVLNLAPGHVAIQSQVRPGAEYNYLAGEHGGSTFAAVQQMYLAYLGSVGAQPEEGVEPGVFVNFIISTNTSNYADLDYIRMTAFTILHQDFSQQAILDQYNIPWALRKMNNNLGMWSQQVAYCPTSAGVGEEAPSNPIFYATQISDYFNPNPAIPVQSEDGVELVFDASCIPSVMVNRDYGYGFGFSFSIVGGFFLVGYLILLDTKIKKAAQAAKAAKQLTTE